MAIFVQLLVNGLLLGGVYAIICVGLTLIFGVIRIVNFAHGELLMVGMYATYLLGSQLGWHPYISALPVALLLFVIGCLIQRIVIQPLLNADHSIQIFATVGISVMLLNLALLFFGADVFKLETSLGNNRLQIGGMNIVVGQLITFCSAFLLAFLLHWFLHKSYVGIALRAVAQNRYAAGLMGVRVDRIYIYTFGIGSACVGLAAALVSTQFPIFPTIGSYFTLTAFVVVVLGGLGNLYGALLGAMIIGVVDSMAAYYIAPSLKEVVYFIIFIIILVVRPTGLLGLGRGSE